MPLTFPPDRCSMGISGLLALLAPITQDVHLSAYAGQRIAVDAYVWLHKGAYTCAIDLALNRPTTAYINFCMKRIALLRSFNITPVMVFDGANLEAKRSQESSRAKTREDGRMRGQALLKAGKRDLAFEQFQKAIDITPTMAHALIVECRKHNIECIVAPYEADAQLAHLARTRYVSAVISEDSDLIVYQCPKILYKLTDEGNAREIQTGHLGADLASSGVDFTGWVPAKFTQMCILSGCDYLPSIQSVGLKTAYKLLRKHGDAQKVIKHMRHEGSYPNMPPDYEVEFIKVWLSSLMIRPCSHAVL